MSQGDCMPTVTPHLVCKDAVRAIDFYKQVIKLCAFFGEIIVELKAASALAPEHEAQLLNYLKATGKPVGYLINFGSRGKLEWRRFARTRESTQLSEP